MSDFKPPQHYMQQALVESQKAYDKDEVPIGAVIVLNGEIIARAHNGKEITQDPTKHAEITAIQKASESIGSWRLNECDMYVTLEPCTMCAGAIIQARLNRLFVGAEDPKAGAVGSVLNVLAIDSFNHQVDVTFGVLQEECSAILKDFFSKLRNK